MNDPKEEIKRKILQAATGEIELTTEELEKLKKEDTENLFELAHEFGKNKELLYALQNPASKKETEEILASIKQKHSLKLKSKENVFSKLSRLWNINKLVPVFVFSIVLLLLLLFGKKFYPSENTFSHEGWVELAQHRMYTFSEKEISLNQKAFYIGFYSRLFQTAPTDSYSNEELEKFISPYLPSIEFRLRLDKLKKLKMKPSKDSEFKEELISFFVDAEKKIGDNTDYLTIGKAVCDLYIYTLTNQISAEYTQYAEKSIRFLEGTNNLTEEIFSKEELLYLLNDQTCIKSGQNCEDIKNRIYRILNL